MLPFSLGLVVAAVPPETRLPAFTDQKEVESVLGGLGYKVRFSGPRTLDGVLVHGGVEVPFALALVVGDPAKGTKTHYLFMSISLELAVPEAKTKEPEGAPLGERSAPWPTVAPGTSAAGSRRVTTTLPTFVPHLGGTVTETAQVDLQEGGTRGQIREALDGFWKAGQTYAKAHGVGYVPAPTFDPAKTPLGDALTLDRADVESFQRAVATWGWSDPTLQGYAGQGWIFPMKVAGRTLYLRQMVSGTEGEPRAVEIARYDDKPTTRNPWTERKAASEPMPTVVYAPDGMHLATTVETLDLSKGLTLGEIRRRIAAFAAKA